jgi:hypothetical protein
VGSSGWQWVGLSREQEADFQITYGSDFGKDFYSVKLCDHIFKCARMILS